MSRKNTKIRMVDFPLTIIGGGAIGCAIAYEASKKLEDVLVLERNESIRGENQSTRNSGVIHAGIYYTKDSLKARLCLQGNHMMKDYCRKKSIPVIETGKVIVAKNEEETKS